MIFPELQFQFDKKNICRHRKSSSIDNTNISVVRIIDYWSFSDDKLMLVLMLMPTLNLFYFINLLILWTSKDYLKEMFNVG